MIKLQKRRKMSIMMSEILAMLILIMCFTTACQSTPEKGLVKNKKQDTFMDNLINRDKTPETLTPANNIFSGYTQSWEEMVQVKPHNIKVNIDANVVIPDVSSLPVYTVLPEKITQKQVDTFLDQFGDVEFRLNTLLKTKSDYQQIILELQQYLATELNDIDDADEKERARQECESGIEFNKQMMQDAPESIDDVIEPIFTNKYIIALASEPEVHVDNEDKPDENNLEPWTAKEEYERTNTEAIDVKWVANHIPMTLMVQRSDNLPSNSFHFHAGQDETFARNVMENTSDLKGFQTTYEQAKSLAKNTLAKLGLDYMSVAHSAKEIIYTGNPDFSDTHNLDYKDQSYVFYFTRNIDGVNETYCANGQGYFDRFDEPWPYVKLYVIVEDSGVTKIHWHSTGSSLGEKISDDSKLLPFDQIEKIAAEQFAIGNIAFPYPYAENNFKGLVNMNLNIDEVVLGYARVKLSDNSGRYVMIPVWDFFGNYEAVNNYDKNQPTITQYSKQYDSVSDYRQSYLTINAIDGSVIDRSLGY